MAARSRWGIRWARAARGSSPRRSINCVARAGAMPCARCASGSARASLSSSSASRPLAGRVSARTDDVRRAEDLFAQLPITRQLRRIDADVLDLGSVQAALLDDFELLVARIDDGVGFLGVDDRQNRHVAVAQQKADLLIRDLAKGAKPFHPLRADLHLQHIREAHAREDLLLWKRRPEEHVD